MRFQVLTQVEARIVDTLGQTLFPKGGRLNLDARDARVIDYVDRYIAGLPRQDQKLVRLMLLMFGATAPRDPAARKAWLSRWENGRLYTTRVIFQGLRSVFTLAYLSDPDVLGRMGVEDGTEILLRRAGAANAAPQPSNHTLPPEMGEASA